MAKLQELKGLLKLLETLTLQLNDSKQSYKEDLEALNGQVKLREEAMEREREHFDLIQGIDEKVTESLQSLLVIFRGVNVDIFRARRYLDRIPSKPELLFVGVQSLDEDSLRTKSHSPWIKSWRVRRDWRSVMICSITCAIASDRSRRISVSCSLSVGCCRRIALKCSTSVDFSWSK